MPEPMRTPYKIPPGLLDKVFFTIILIVFYGIIFGSGIAVGLIWKPLL